MRLRLALLVALATAAFIAAGVSSTSVAAPQVSSGQQATISTLRFGWPRIFTLDYARQYGSLVGWIEPLGVESLMRTDARGQVQPWLARSVERPNRLTYIYNLRKGVRFWDGSELTAEDAAHALNYYRYPGFLTSTDNGNPSVRSIVARDRYTVVVTLKRPDASWEVVPAIQAPIFQKKFQQEHGARMGAPGVMIMGTGPFRFVSFDPNRGLELVANPNWWRGPVPVQRISIKFITDETAMALAFRAGEIDFSAFFIDPRTFPSTSGGLRPTVVRGCGAWYLSMNVTKPPFDDVHVRRAVAYALNRSALIQAEGGVQVPVTTLPSRQSLLSLGTAAQVDKVLKSVPKYPFNLSKARAEMAQSKYANGGTTWTPVPTNFGSTAVWQALASQLDRIGIKMELRARSPAQNNALIRGPREDIDTVFFPQQCPTAEPSYVAGRDHSKQARTGGNNYSNYKNARVDAFIDQARTTTDRLKRLELYGKMLEIQGRDVYKLPAFSQDLIVGLSNGVRFPGFNVYTMYNSGWATGFSPRG